MDPENETSASETLGSEDEIKPAAKMKPQPLLMKNLLFPIRKWKKLKPMNTTKINLSSSLNLSPISKRSWKNSKKN